MRRWISCLIVGLLAWPAAAAAQGFIIPELGARKNGMGAAIGRVDDLSAIYHNPAALALLEGTRISVSGSLAVLGTDIRLAQWPGAENLISDPVDAQGYYARQSPTVPAPIPFIGISTNLFSKKVVGALGLYVPNAAGADFGRDVPSRYHITDAYVVSAFATAAVAYRPWPWLSVGIGGSAVYVKVKRRSFFYPVLENGMDMTTMLGGDTEFELEGDSIAPAFNIGIQVWPTKNVSLGFMLLSSYDVSLEGPLTLKLGPDAISTFDTPAFTDNQQRTEIPVPWVIAFGANWDITPRLEIGAEMRVYFTSVVDKQVTTITNDGVLKTFLPDGIITPKDSTDTIHTGGGLKYRPPLSIDLDLMAGVHYENASAPDETFEVSAPSFELVAFHLGARWRFANNYQLGLMYTRYQYFERDISTSITLPPTNVIASAYTNMVTLTFEARLAGGLGVK